MSKLVALVTGSNRGIGKSCILEFARAGINVVINYCHRKEEAEALKQEIEEKYKVEVLVVKCDVSKEDGVVVIAPIWFIVLVLLTLSAIIAGIVFRVKEKLKQRSMKL